MSHKRFKLINSFILIAVLFTCAAKKNTSNGNDSLIIISQGSADIRDAGMTEALDRAYLDAQRKAVENALGKIYYAQTVVEAGKFIEETVIANIKGYIRKWKKQGNPVIANYPGTGYKVVNVKIEAEVGLGKLKEDMVALKEIQMRLGRPDLAIDLDNLQANKELEKILNKYLFTVYELKNAPGDKIDIIIDGKVTSETAGKIMEGVDLISCQADVVLKARLRTSGEILAQASGHGASPHINIESGKAAAIEKAVFNAGEDLVKQLFSAWENILNNGRDVYLNITGIKLADEAEFSHMLKNSIRGINEMYTKGYNNGVLRYKLKYLGELRYFAKDLDVLDTIKVNSYDGNSIDAEIE